MPQPRGTAPRWWEHPAFAVALVLATAVPLLWPAIPPLADYPGHIASYHLSHALAGSPFLQGFFRFRWVLIGNLGVDLPMVPLGWLLGVEPAAKLIAVAVPTATCVAMLAVARAAHGRLPATAPLALPFIYNFYLHFGFINFALGVCIALFALAAWLRWPAARRPLARWACFAALAALTWLAHAIAWIMLCAMCAGVELVRVWRAGFGWHALLRAGVAVTALAAPLVLMRLAPAGGPTTLSGWLTRGMLKHFVLVMLHDRWLPFDLASLAAIGLFLIAAPFRPLRLRFNPALLLASAGLVAAFLVLPVSINGSWWVNGRILPYAVALLLLALDPSRLPAARQAGLAAAAALFFAIRTAATTASLFLYGQSYTAQLAALDRLPRHAVVVALVRNLCVWPDRGTSARLEHLPAMAIVRRDAFVNVEWDVPGLQLLRVAHGVPGFASDGSQNVIVPGCGYPPAGTYQRRIDALPRGAFTHLWLLDIPRPLWPRLPWLHLVWQGQDRDGHPSALFRADPR